MKEGKEIGKDPRDFAAQLLQGVLNLDERPKLDWVHRALRARTGPVAQPRQLILKIHHSYVLEDIMKKVANKRNLIFEGDNIRIFRDYPAKVVQKRALFTKSSHSEVPSQTESHI